MARSYGRIQVRIWADDDFRDLPEPTQRLYLMLISQPGLNMAGLLAYQPRRWTAHSTHSTMASVISSLAWLIDRRFVLVDLSTEELLVRSACRNDLQVNNSKAVLGLKSSAEEITSPALRHALAVELRRITIDDPADNPGKYAGNRATLTALITEMERRPITNPSVDPSALCEAEIGPIDWRSIGRPIDDRSTSLALAPTHTHAATPTDQHDYVVVDPTADQDQEQSSSSSTEDETLNQLATDLEQALGRPVRLDTTPSFTAIDRTRLATAIGRHGTQPYIEEARAASNGRGPADHAAAYLPRWRALTERLDRQGPSKPKPVTCQVHQLEHPAGAQCPGCRADTLVDDQAPPVAPDVGRGATPPAELLATTRAALARNSTTTEATTTESSAPEPVTVPAWDPTGEAPTWPAPGDF